MQSVWLVFCDCDFHSVFPLIEKDMRLMEASRWEILTEGKAGCFSDGAAMPSKSLIQFSVDRWDCVLSLLFDLRPNYDGGKEDNGDIIQKVPCTHCCTHSPRPCSRLPPAHASAGDSWTLTDKSGSVSCVSLLLSPWSWCVQVFVCALQETGFPVLCKFWQPYSGVMATNSNRANAIPRSTASRAPAPAAVHC